MIILDTYAEKIQNEDFFRNLEVIYSPDFFLKTYTIEQKVLENLFVRKNKNVDFFRSYINNFNLEAFSIKEFWWFGIISPPEKNVKCDLTSLFIESNCNKNAPTLDELLLTAKKITDFVPKSTLNYEEEESWATITTLEKTVCIIGVNVAVIFVLNEYVDIIQKAVDLNPILIIPVDSYETQEYKVDIPLMKKEFPFWHLEYLPPVFSIYDFIF
jgi:hypothetical protein